MDDGGDEGHAEVRLTSATPATRGKVSVVPPYAIHSEMGGTGRSVAVILRNAAHDHNRFQGCYDVVSKTRKRMPARSWVTLDRSQA